jgi:Zn-finger nucleic acid-binding protein
MTPVCPKCDVELFILNFKDVEVDYCDRCRGLWLDTGELEQLMQNTGATAEDPLLGSLNRHGAFPAGQQDLCPRCDQRMCEVKIASEGRAPLTLERCPLGHGLWFDANELRQLLAMFPAAGAGRTIEFLNSLFGQTTNP